MLHLLAAFYSTPWALDPVTHSTIETVLTRWADGTRLDAAQIHAAIGTAPQAAAQRRDTAAQLGGGAVAVLPVYGVLTHRAVDAEASSTPLTSTERLGAQIKAAVANPDISALVLDINSPGGSVFGVQEVADTIYSLRGTKPIIAVASPAAASGAYWIAAQADELVVTPSGMVGSLGVIMKHTNRAEAYKQKGQEDTYITSGQHKAEGNDSGPLSPETRAYMQQVSDGYYAAFVNAVARGRNQPVSVVRSEAFGQGRMLTAAAAVAAGAATRIGTLESVVAELLQRPATQHTAPGMQRRPGALHASTARAQLDAIDALSTTHQTAG